MTRIKPVGSAMACMFLVGLGGSVLLVVLPAVGTEFRTGVGGLARLGATLAIGTAVALPLALLADRWRRGPMALLGVAGFTLAAVASAAAPGVAELAMARFVAVCCETLVASIATAAAVEAVSSQHRGAVMALLALGGGAGAAVTVIAYPVLAPHWRLLYLGAGATGVALGPLAWFVPGRGASGGWGVAALMAAPWRRHLGLLGGAAGLGSALYEPANFFAVLFGSQRLGLSPTALSVVLAASGLAAGAGFICGGILTDRVGRRLPAAGLGVAGAVLAGVSFVPQVGLYVGAGVLWSLLAGAAAPVIAAWTGELVPADTRVTGYTVVGVAGALGGVAGLYAVGGLSGQVGLTGAILLTVLPAVGGALLLLALPETAGQELPR